MAANRILININTGATFIWTEKLAAKTYMDEITGSVKNSGAHAAAPDCPAPSDTAGRFLKSLKKAELLELARDYHITGLNNSTRAQIIARLEEKQNAAE